jgi:hypothetical protein
MTKPNQSLLRGTILLITILSACVSSPIEVPATSAIPPAITPLNTLPAYWSPSPSDSFQLQLSDYPPDLSAEADVFELDLFETPQEIIDSLHEAGKRVICYINVGAWEEYRPDADAFPDAVIGKEYIGWDGERWLDISNYKSFGDLISTRLTLAASKGCDGIDPDNINGFQQDTGFSISAQDQLTYQQVSDLLDYFDFALIEDCTVYGECTDFLPFIEQGKAVFQVEYTDKFSSTADFCSTAIANNYSGIFKNRELDAWTEPCPSA